MWGGRLEERAKITALRMRDGEDVALVELRPKPAVIHVGCKGVEGGDIDTNFDGRREDEEGENGKEEEEEEEGILDVAVGENHILALTTMGRVYAVGEGKWGQLGTDRKKFESEWVQVQVQMSIGETRRDGGVDDVDDTAGVEEAVKRAERHASEEKSTENPPGAGDRKYPVGKKIVGVECGLWNSFLLVSVGV